jgi:hypothetical protein
MIESVAFVAVRKKMNYFRTMQSVSNLMVTDPAMEVEVFESRELRAMRSLALSAATLVDFSR